MAIHPLAEVHPNARIHPTAEIGPRVVILEDVEIGEGCEIMAGAIIGPRVKMGKFNRVHYYAVIGHEPQHTTVDPKVASGVVIGDYNNFREQSSVHRSIYAGQNTIIGNNNYIMTSGHVAHDCVLGNHIVITNLAAVAGHVSIGDRAFISAPVGVHQWVRVGRLAMVGGMTAVSQDVPPFMIVKRGGELTGLNTIGLRRADVGVESRLALKQVYRFLFRLGMPLKAALTRARADFAGKPMPAEVAELLDFCAAPTKRGVCRGPRGRGGAELSEPDAE